MHSLARASALLLATFLPAAPAQDSAKARMREIAIPASTNRARVWSEAGRDFTSVSLDGEHFHEPRAVDYALELRYRRFDPLEGEPRVPAELRATGANRLFVVQSWTQVLESYRTALRAAGAELLFYLPETSNVVALEPSELAGVRALPFVRSVTPFHPAYKLEESLLGALARGTSGALKIDLLTTRRGEHAPVMRWIENRGGVIEHVSEPTHFMTATISWAHLAGLAALDEVQWIDPASEPGHDMNKARDLHGADFVEALHGLTGTGVRVEVMDLGCDTSHPDFDDFLVHNGNVVDGGHGTCTSGIVLGDGTNRPGARGAAPDATLVIADYGVAFAGGNRYNHTGQLVNPALAFKCVLQSNSWGGSLTAAYNSTSQNMDLILFDHERISILQSQSNAGSTQSRPEAWAKNVISVGGIIHNDTTSKSDDSWSGGASIGPAADGRIKPDLASFFDAILCADQVGSLGYSSTDYYNSFGGTSGATPIVAGHLALIYEMWHLGLFGNAHPGATPFDNAPNNTTAKALLINSASPWNFSGAAHDLTRTHQGWGHPDLERLSNSTARMLVIDESEVLTELQTRTWTLEVLPGETRLAATLVYRDPPGTTSAATHRINDLDLKLTSPTSVVYRGNVGLSTGNVSTSGGVADTKNTVENVFLDNPESGLWTIEVRASDVNQDSHTETPAVDVDFALVVSGADESSIPPVAPANLRGEASPHQAYLAWDDLSLDELAFELERSDDGVTFAPLASLGANTTSHIDAGRAPNSTHHYRVRATNTAGPSAWSNVLVLTGSKTRPR
jgi:hypothetical protein